MRHRGSGQGHPAPIVLGRRRRDRRTPRKSDDDGRSYTYSIISSPLPINNYTSTLRVLEDEDGKATVEWSSEFDSAGAPESDAMKIVEGIYSAGFDNLKKMFGG
jgi:hypothetical protein